MRDRFRIRMYRADGLEVGEPEEFGDKAEARDMADYLISTGEINRVVVEEWKGEGLHGQGWYGIEEITGKEEKE